MVMTHKASACLIYAEAKRPIAGCGSSDNEVYLGHCAWFSILRGNHQSQACET